jgi:hypothetical protein
MFFKQLHANIQHALTQSLVGAGYIRGVLDHYDFNIGGDKTYMLFMPIRTVSSAFAIEVDLNDINNFRFHIGELEAYGSRNPVDRDKSIRPLDINKVIVKGYVKQGDLGRNSTLVELSVIYNIAKLPKQYPRIELTHRERSILYCFGVLKNNGFRREALSRLAVVQPEIDSLIAKGVLKMTGAGPIMTKLGIDNRSATVKVDLW